MRVGVGSSGAVVSCLGGDGGRTPPILSPLSQRTIYLLLNCKKKVWRDVMQEEISAILKNKTWTMVKPRKDVKPTGVKWVFRVKKDNMGKTVTHKARFLVKGYVQ